MDSRVDSMRVGQRQQEKRSLPTREAASASNPELRSQAVVSEVEHAAVAPSTRAVGDTNRMVVRTGEAPS